MRSSLRSISLTLLSLLALSPLALAQTAPVQSLVINWNLVGNNSPAAIDPVSLFGNASTPVTGISDQITTVWKWNTANTNWMFFAPSMTPASLATYTTGKFYGVLATIPSGDGYWVNAKAPLTLTLPSGTASTTAPLQSLVSGWNLVGNNTTAAIDPVTLFGDKTTPLSGISSQVVTVWKWNAVNAAWMFYAPSMTAAELATYAASKNYGVLTTILPGEGYWVNTAAGGLNLSLPPVISGVAASGAPIANGDIKLTCGDGSTRTTTTDANGAFSVGLANCSAPYVVSATGNIGDAQESLVSVQANSPASGAASLIMNVTPLTHAISASIASSGDPFDLVSNFVAQKANITDTATKAAKGTLVAAIANTLTQAGGDPTTFDPVGTPFSANRSGMDKLLDNLQIQVNGSGVSITSPSAVAAVDDMGDQTKNSAPVGADILGSSAFAAATITLGKGSTATPLPAGGGLQDHSIGDTVRDALNACFAQPAATRGTIAAGTLSTACQAVPIASDYLNDGNTAAQEFDPFFSNSKNDNAKFNIPEIIRFYSNTASDTRALIKFALTRPDGVVKSFATVGEKSTAKTGDAKMLRGNQRKFRLFVNGYVHKRTEIEARNASNPKSTFYFTGINLYFGLVEGGAGGTASGTAPSDGSRKVAYVKVSGPGLPAAGVFLNPLLSGCDSNYAIAADATTAPANCTSLYRMSSRAATASDTDNFASKYGNTTSPDPAFPSAKMTDAQLLQIKPLSAYKFEIWQTNNATTTPDYVYIERLRSRPYTMGTAAAQDGEIDKVRWNTLSADTIAALDPIAVPGAAFVGGKPSSFTLKWTNQPNAAPTGTIQVQTRKQTGSQLYQDKTDVPFSASSAVLTNGSQGWPDMNLTTSSGINMAQLISRNRYDTQLFVDWIY